MPNDDPDAARWEHFQHGADIGIRGVGLTKQQAFEQAALALTAAVTSLDKIRAQAGVGINCTAPTTNFFSWTGSMH